MEDFVYIILLIVWLLVSFLRKKPKKKQPEPAKQQEPNATKGEVNMEDMIEEFFGGGKKKKEQQPAYDAADESRKPDRREAIPETAFGKEEPIPESFEQHVGKAGVAEEFEFSSEGKILTIDDLIKSHKAKEAMELAMAEQEYDRDNAGGVPDFDLETAVVFSEILNKKYH